MLRRCWILATCLIVVVAWMPGPIQSAPRFTVNNWKTENGLPQSTVLALTQTKDGFLWLGTLGGLARFDGIQFKVYNDGNTPGLKSGRIWRLFEDRQQRLWIALEKGGIVVATENGSLLKLPFDAASAELRLLSWCEDSAGSIWLQMSDKSLFVYTQNKLSLILRGCTRVMSDNSGLVWVGTENGNLVGLRFGDGAAVVQHELPTKKLDWFLSSRRGGYWRLADGKIQRWEADHAVGPAFDYPWQPATPITSVCEDNEGNLVVGTGGDYVYWFNKDGIAEHVRNLSHATIMALCMDREGSLWVGTDGGGLNRVRRQSFEVVEFNRYAKSVSEDPQGNVWLASAGQIIQVTTNGAALLQLKAGALPDVGVVLALDSRHLFAGTVDGLFEIADGIPHSLSNPQVPGQISALHIDQSKTLWAGGRNGLTYLAPNGQSGATTVDSHPILDVQSITSDADGNLWIGTDGTGLYRLHDDKFQAFTRTNALPSDNVSYLYTDGAGVLWVATSGGLARYEKGKWTRYGKNEGLVNERIGYIIEDAHNFLWLGTTTGLIRAQKQELDDFAHGHTNALMFRGFGEGDGLPNSECSFGSQPGPCRTRDGKLWFPTILGVATVDPSKLTPNSNPPPVVIEAVRIDGKLQNQDTLRASPLRSLVVPPHSESLEIDYASLNLAAPEKGRIKFRLQGYETSWTDRPSNQRSARYPQLPPNHYVFQVAACNEDGVWNEQGTALAITVLPPFWRTWWFLSLSSLCLLGLIVGSVHYVSTQKLHRQLESLRQQEALERERARIARDLHDQLGANLTQVTLLGEMAEADKNLPQEVEAHAQQICQTARETTRSLDEIVWTVNPSNDTLEGLINYVCKYAQDYLAVAGLKYRLDVPPSLPATPISPELRHNVFLAAKESITNVVRHARATAAVVRLHLDANRFTLEIEDDGQGLANMDQKRAATRNGLRNMRKRMEDVGGTFEMLPAAEHGTLVRLTAPLAKI